MQASESLRIAWKNASDWDVGKTKVSGKDAGMAKSISLDEPLAFANIEIYLGPGSTPKQQRVFALMDSIYRIKPGLRKAFFVYNSENSPKIHILNTT